MAKTVTVEGWLYRGVHAGHPAMAAARAGMAVPGDVGGQVSAAEHNLGGPTVQSESPFTSFTQNLDVARVNARKAGAGGIILVAPVGAPQVGDTWNWEWSPDEFGEAEVLLRGTRTGLEVREP
jgi:hypothetical protein